jgi:hypothetical protein
MNITMTEGLHLTATNKRHISEMLTKGITEGGTKALHYIFTNIEDGFARLTIVKHETNDQGRKVSRRANYAVTFKP